MSDRTILTRVKILPGYREPDNFEARVLATFVGDFSGSMSEHAPKLPRAWNQMVAALGKQVIQRLRIELACCLFDDRVVYHDYAPVQFYLDKPIAFDGRGLTSLGTALLTVIDGTRRRRQQLASEGIPCCRTLCPVVSDGGATDAEVINVAIREIARAETMREIEFIPLAPTPHCAAQLHTVFGKEPILLDTVDFDELFHALTRSLSTYSQSVVGQEPDGRTLIHSELLGQARRRQLPGPDQVRRIGYHED